MALRDAINFAGTDLRQPVNLQRRMQSFNKDDDVNKALMNLLGGTVSAWGKRYMCSAWLHTWEMQLLEK